MVALHRKGTIDLDHYRGCCVDPTVVQAAEWFARRRTGPLGTGDLVLPGRRPARGRSGVGAVPLPGGVLRVLLRVSRAADPRPLTCHSLRAEPPHVFDLLSLAAEPEP